MIRGILILHRTTGSAQYFHLINGKDSRFDVDDLAMCSGFIKLVENRKIMIAAPCLAPGPAPRSCPLPY